MKLVFSTIIALALLATPVIGQNLPRIYIEAVETVDAEDSEKKVRHAGFGMALSAALFKHKVPVSVTTDKDKADWAIQSIPERQEDGDSGKTRPEDSFTRFKGTIQVVNIENSEILFANTVSRRGNFQRAAENFARNFKRHLDRKR